MRSLQMGILIATSLLAPVAWGQCPPNSLFAPGITTPGNASAVIETADFNEDGIADLVTGWNGVAVGDFNSDGILDLASRGVYLRLGDGANGKGNGTFRLEQLYSAATNDSILVHLGQGLNGVGNGTFASPIMVQGHSRAIRMKTSDFDADGMLDLLLLNNNPCCPSALPDTTLFVVLRGVGDGTFGAPEQHRLVGPASYGNFDKQAMAVADFNQDGINDIAVAGPWTPTWVFFGTGAGGVGNGGFSSPVAPAGPSATDLDGADIDEDGNVDLVFRTFSGMAIARNLGGGVFAPPIVYPDGSSADPYGDVLTADFNHDGILDVAIGDSNLPDPSSPPNYLAKALCVFIGQGSGGVGSGTFASPEFYRTPAFPAAMVSGDFLEDGMTDVFLGSALHVGRCPDPVISAPQLIAVSDVAGDQGGRVSVTWARSSLDQIGTRLVTGYTVWRRVAGSAVLGLDQLAAGGRAPVHSDVPTIRARTESGVTTFWEALQTLPAHFFEGYGYTASTTRDSMLGRNPYTAFLVSAVTEDPYLFFESNVDSGYSVDNLAPGVPKGMRGLLIPESGDLLVHWHPNPEPDMHHYNLYRGHFPGFDANQTTLLAAPPDTMYLDVDFGVSTFYKVSAVDIHGNESSPPVAVSVTEAAGFRTRLYTPIVPAGGGPVQIRYAIGPEAAPVRVEIFDVSGRRVRLLDQGVRMPAEYLRTWDRRDGRGRYVAQGVYVVRLIANPHSSTEKLVLLRR